MDHKYVELKPGYEDFYPDVIVGSRGWVTEEKTDTDGFLLAFIEWDTAHWRYNGQPNGWSYASHFREIENTSELLAKMLGEKQERPEEDFDAALDEAIEIMKGSKGFIILTAIEVQDILSNNELITVPLVFSRFKDEGSAQVLFAQLGHLNLILLTDLLRGGDDPGWKGATDFPSDL